MVKINQAFTSSKAGARRPTSLKESPRQQLLTSKTPSSHTSSRTAPDHQQSTITVEDDAEDASEGAKKEPKNLKPTQTSDKPARKAKLLRDTDQDVNLQDKKWTRSDIAPNNDSWLD